MLNLNVIFSFRCVVFSAKEAEDKHILSVHSKNHVSLIKKISSKQFDSRRNRIALNFNSIYMNEGSSEAAYLAAGSVIEVIILSHTFIWLTVMQFLYYKSLAFEISIMIMTSEKKNYGKNMFKPENFNMDLFVAQNFIL